MTVKVNFGTGFKLFVKLVARASMHVLSNHVSCSCALFLLLNNFTSTSDLNFGNKTKALQDESCRNAIRSHLPAGLRQFKASIA
jgi:hypothetical protein